ncbi:TetR/AcrR family transcriptional regulator [Jatrophihabitans sp. YIM 134969]
MPRTKSFDEAVAVAAAREVFWARGYVATSVADLQAATGLSRSSLYETFGSKRELFDRAATDYVVAILEPVLAPLEADGAAGDEVAGWFDAFGAHFRDAPSDVVARGCLMINTATELHALDEAAAHRVVGFRRRIRAAFLNGARGMRVADPEAYSDLLTAQHLGMVMTSRMDGPAAVRLAEHLAAEVRATARAARRRRR